MAGEDGTSDHLTSSQLDAVRTGEGSAADRSHLVGCASCRASLKELRALAEAFRDITAEPVGLAPKTEARILWHARKRARAARIRPSWRRALPAWAAAASIVLALATSFYVAKHGGSHGTLAAADVDHNGIIDIRDVLLLAEAIQAGSETTPRYDLNGDGVIDQRDVDAIAARAVSLSETS